jgi:hypothetical protein
MGIKGTVRRSTDGHIIHANVDTDIIISEEPEYGSLSQDSLISSERILRWLLYFTWHLVSS